MQKTLNVSDYRTPGQLILDLLKQREWTQRVLAIILGIDESVLNKIIAAKRPVDAALALTLGEVFNVDPELFLDLQKAWDLTQARLLSRPDPNRSTRAALFGSLPISDMIKRGWLEAEDVRDVEAVEASLERFFGRPAAEIEPIAHAAKKTNSGSAQTLSQTAWLFRVKHIASEMMVSKFSSDSFKEALAKLKPLLVAPEEARHVPRILTEAGIRFVIVESLPGAKMDGACTWLNSKSPVVAMTCRFDRIDNFWFVLRHELEHVARQHGMDGAMFDAELEGENAGTGPNVPEQERQANEAAANFCLSQRKLDAFIARKNPFFAERDLIGFAKTEGVHPGIVAGQLQNRTKRYDRFRSHLAKIRTMVAPSATVDGWGDVAPVDIDGNSHEKRQ